MKNLYAALFLLFIVPNTLFSQLPKDTLDRYIDKVDESFRMGRVKPLLGTFAEDFTFNNVDALVSKQMLTTVISGFPAKKIRGVEVLSNEQDKATVKCKIVIDKFMGIFAQPMTFDLQEKDGRTYITNWNIEGADMSVSTGSDDDVEKEEVVLSEMNYLTQKDIVTYYPESYDEVAQKVHNRQLEGVGFIESKLHEPLIFKLGMLLLDRSTENITLDQPVLPLEVKDKSELPGDSIAQFFINWAYFHELTELHLTLGYGISDPNTRWFRDGMADYYAQLVAAKLDEGAHKMIMEKRASEYDAIDRKGDLINWIGTGSNKSRRGFDGGAGQYTAAMYFFMDLTKEYGEELIPQTLSTLSNKKNITSKKILRVMSKLTGENIKKRLEEY